MRNLLPLAATASFLALSACSQTSTPPTAEPERSVPADGASAYVQSLVGEYRLVAIAGREPGFAHEEGAAVMIGPERIRYESQCVYGDWTYRIERGVLYTQRYHEPGSVMCQRGLYPEEEAIERVLDAVTGWRRLPGGNLLIEGPRETLELRPLDVGNGKDGAAIASLDGLVGEYRVAGIDGSAMDGAMGIAVSVTPETLSYEPRCLGFVWSIAMESGGVLQLERHPDYGSQTGTDGTTVSCLPAVTPEFGELASALDQVNRANRTESNGVVLSGGGRSVTLFKQ